jgi:hypothetical protein|tara:strand:- start:351 stop:530 length:180 start_codon:yes stop_codon:yes gene_type:complete
MEIMESILAYTLAVVVGAGAAFAILPEPTDCRVAYLAGEQSGIAQTTAMLTEVLRDPNH